MGLSSKKSKSTQTIHSTVTPNNQPYVDQGLAGLTGKIMDLSKLDPYSMVAGADPLQTQAGQASASLGANSAQSLGQFHAGLGGATSVAQGVAGAAAPRAIDHLQDYMNPYMDQVVNASLADYDFGAGQSRAQNTLSMANLDDTFGGSGRFIQTPMLEDALTRGRGTLSAGLRSQGFDTALGAAQNDAGLADSNLSRQLAASGQLGQFASMGLAGDQNADANTRANITSQSAMGDILRQIQQQKLAAPLNLLSTQTGLFGSLPLDLQHGETTDGTANTVTKSSGSVLDSVAKAAKIAATVAAFSDERLKADIQTVRHDAKGRRWVDYRYLWDEPGVTRHGVIAQEVAKTDPHAVVRHESGYLMVKYGELH